MTESERIDRRAVRRQFSRRVSQLPDANYLLRETESQMLSRLDLVTLQPAAIIEIGSGLGDGVLALRRRYPSAAMLGIDAAEPLVRRAQQRLAPPAGGYLGRLFGSNRRPRGPLASFAVADADALPVAASSTDLIWSNLCLHWLPDPARTLREWHRVIRPGGLLMFSLFGVDTLKELRRAGADLMALPDMHDLGDALVAAGFADPVMDMRFVTVAFGSPDKVIDDLRCLGGNALPDRRTGLTGRAWLRRCRLDLSRLRDTDGAIAVTFEIIYGHAWCPSTKRLPDGLKPVEFHRGKVDPAR